MASINLNNYTQISAMDLVSYLFNTHRYVTYQDILDDLDDHLFDWVEAYLSSANIEYGDLGWEDGISDLNTELGDYLYDKTHDEIPE